jgi:hypothetical protein
LAAAEQAIIDAVEAKNRVIFEEAEYLTTLSSIQWFIYPFFKMFEALIDKIFGCCKSERIMREPPISDKKQN